MTYLWNQLGINVWDVVLLRAFINFILCAAIGWACICRITATSSTTTRTIVRASHCLLLVAAMASGLGPMFGEWPGWADLLMSLAAVLYLAAGMRAWAFGTVPAFAKTARVAAESEGTER